MNKVILLLLFSLLVAETTVWSTPLDDYFKSHSFVEGGLSVQTPTSGIKYLLVRADTKEKDVLGYGEHVFLEYGKGYSFNTRHLQISFLNSSAGNAFNVQVVKDFTSFGGEIKKDVYFVAPPSSFEVIKKGDSKNLNSSVEVPEQTEAVSPVIGENVNAKSTKSNSIQTKQSLLIYWVLFGLLLASISIFIIRKMARHKEIGNR